MSKLNIDLATTTYDNALVMLKSAVSTDDIKQWLQQLYVAASPHIKPIGIGIGLGGLAGLGGSLLSKPERRNILTNTLSSALLGGMTGGGYSLARHSLSNIRNTADEARLRKLQALLNSKLGIKQGSQTKPIKEIQNTISSAATALGLSASDKKKLISDALSQRSTYPWTSTLVNPMDLAAGATGAIGGIAASKYQQFFNNLEALRQQEQTARDVFDLAMRHAHSKAKSLNAYMPTIPKDVFVLGGSARTMPFIDKIKLWLRGPETGPYRPQASFLIRLLHRYGPQQLSSRLPTTSGSELRNLVKTLSTPETAADKVLAGTKNKMRTGAYAGAGGIAAINLARLFSSIPHRTRERRRVLQELADTLSETLELQKKLAK